MKKTSRVTNAFLTLAASAALIQSGFAETSAATTGNWGNSGTWTNGVPDSLSGVGIGGNHTVTYNTGDIYTGGGFFEGLIIGYGSWATSNWGNPPPTGPFITNPGDGILNVAGGTLNTGYLALGDATSPTAIGTLNITDGVVNNNQDMLVSWAAPGSSINISGGSFIQSGSGTSNIGQGASASFNASGGTTQFTRYTGVRFGSVVNVSGSAVMSSSGFFMVGDGESGSNELNINGGTFNQTGADLRAGNFATGTITVNSGTLNLNDSNLVSGIGPGGNGLVDINGGSVTSGAGTVTIGNNAVGATTGAFNVDGGSFEKTGGDFIVSQSGTTGTVNQTGGTFGVANFVNGGGTGSYNFTGGTLKANASINFATNGITTSITGATSGGSTIDSNGNTVTVNAAQITLGSGGVLTKTGAGSLTVNNDAGFSTGTWNVNGGSVDMVGYFNGADVNVAGGTLNLNRIDGSHFSLASTSTTTLSSGTINTLDELYLGFSGGNGTFNQSGGALDVAEVFYVGGNGGTGNYNQTGGTLTVGSILGVAAGGSALTIDGSVEAALVGIGSDSFLGGDGTIEGSLDLGAGALFQFDPTSTLTINTGNVTFGGFGVADLVGLTSAVNTGTYSLLDGTATFDYANVSNLGINNAYDLGNGKSAYFDTGGLQLVVVPEPSSLALLAGSLIVMTLIIRRRRSA